jgi:hypothetical protein
VRRSSALRLLAPVHARAIVLNEAGVESAELARRLDLDPSAVGPLLRIARTKLATLEGLEEPATDR